MPYHSHSINFSSPTVDQRGIHLLLLSQCHTLSVRGFLRPYLLFILNWSFISSETRSHKAAPNHPAKAKYETRAKSNCFKFSILSFVILTRNFLLIRQYLHIVYGCLVRKMYGDRGQVESIIVIYEIQILPHC